MRGDGVESIGIIKKMGTEGNIVIPKSLRQRFKIEHNDGIEITLEGDRIILNKYRPRCVFCRGSDCVTDYKDKHVCQECLSSLSQQA